MDPSQLTADDRAFLNEAIRDYDAQFGAAYETSAQGFEGYYEDISRQPAERIIDFDDVDVNSTKLGRTVAQRNDKLTRHMEVIGNPPSSRPVTSQAPRSPTLFLHRSLHARPVSSSSSEYFSAGMVSTHVYSREENLPKSEKRQALHMPVGDVSGAVQAAAPEWTPPRRGSRGRGPSASSP